MIWCLKEAENWVSPDIQLSNGLEFRKRLPNICFRRTTPREAWLEMSYCDTMNKQKFTNQLNQSEINRIRRQKINLSCVLPNKTIITLLVSDIKPAVIVDAKTHLLYIKRVGQRSEQKKNAQTIRSNSKTKNLSNELNQPWACEFVCECQLDLRMKRERAKET